MARRSSLAFLLVAATLAAGCAGGEVGRDGPAQRERFDRWAERVPPERLRGPERIRAALAVAAAALVTRGDLSRLAPPLRDRRGEGARDRADALRELRGWAGAQVEP